MTHDYKRNGTATLFAALSTLDGTVISMCDDRHRHQEWLKFLRLIDQVTPGDKEIHLIADNYANTQTSHGAEVAGPPATIPRLLHSNQQFIAEHGGAFFSRPYSEPAPPRSLLICMPHYTRKRCCKS